MTEGESRCKTEKCKGFFSLRAVNKNIVFCCWLWKEQAQCAKIVTGCEISGVGIRTLQSTKVRTLRTDRNE